MKVAYVLNTYPQPSHSFIRREMQALERQDIKVLRLAMRSSTAPLVDAGDKAEARETHYVLQAGAARLLGAVLACALATPARFRRAFGLAWLLGRRFSSGRLRHLIYLAEAAYVARYCVAEGAQHLHAHFGTNAAAVAMLAHELSGIPYSFTTHGPEEFDAPHTLSLGEKVNRSAFAVAISSFGKSQLSRWADFAAWRRIKVVHCGIEPARFASPAPIPKGPLRLVAVGRFVEQKGQMVLIQAMKRIAAERPDVHLTLIGDGEMRPQLEREIGRFGLDPHITMTGWLDEAGVRAELAGSHVLVMPSFAEGLPMVVMEAMAAARPVLATYVAGTPELVLEDETGWLIPAGDEDALAEAVLKIAGLPQEKLAHMGDLGRQRVLERHNSDTEAAKLAAWFNEASGRG